MTGIGKRKWWSICKDLASAMKTGRQAIIQPSQDGGQIEASLWRWWILRWKSSPSDAEKQMYLIVPRNRVNERPRGAVEGRRRDTCLPMMERRSFKISAQPSFRCCFLDVHAWHRSGDARVRPTDGHFAADWYFSTILGWIAMKFPRWWGLMTLAITWLFSMRFISNILIDM